MMNRRHTKGFTLIELMITVAIVAILAAIAYPSFSDSIRKSRRSDAMASITAIQMAQEKWRGNNSTYGAIGDVWTGTASLDGYYGLALSGVGATGYTITATPAGSQADDTICANLVLAVAGGVVTKTASGTGDDDRCWQK